VIKQAYCIEAFFAYLLENVAFHHKAWVRADISAFAQGTVWRRALAEYIENTVWK